MDSHFNRIGSEVILLISQPSNEIAELSKLLTAIGYNPIEKLPEEAIVVVESIRPKLILLEGQNYDLCQKIKNNRHTKFIPVLFIIDSKTGFETETIFRVGGADYITKPFCREEIKIRIESQLRITQQNFNLRQEIDTTAAELKYQQTEAELQENQRFIQRIADTYPHFLYVYDVIEQRNIYCNKEIANFLGYTPEKIKAMGSNLLLKIVHPEDFDKIPEHLQKLDSANEGDIFEIEYRLKDARGKWRAMFVRETLFNRTSEGKAQQILGTATDISDRKALEQKLIERENRLNAFFNSAPIGFKMVDEEMRFVQINEPLAQINGLPVEDHLGKTVREVLPELADTLEACYKQVMKTGKPILNQELSGEVPSQPGVKRHWLVSYFPIPGADNSAIGVGTAVIEITDIKQTEVQLRLTQEQLCESLEREKALSAVIQRMRQSLDINTIFAATTEELRNLIDCDRVLVYRFSSDWSGTVVSESVEEEWVPLLSDFSCDLHFIENTLDEADCIVKNLSKSSEIQDTYLKNNQEVIYRQGTNYLVVENVAEAGFTSCYLELLTKLQAKAYIIVPIFCRNQLWGLLATYQNSAPRQWKDPEINIVVQIGNQLEVALQQAELLAKTQRQSAALQQAALAADTANRAKSEFLTNMSHELRTPLNAILGFAQIMLRDRALSLEQRENLKIVNRAGQHLLELINDVLEMSKIESGRTSLYEETFDLFSLFKDLNQVVSLKAKVKGINIKFELDQNLPRYVKGDEHKLRQTLLNLLSNAIKFTNVGKVVLRAKSNAVSLALRQAQISFEVEDTGLGIAPEELHLLFEPFSQTETGKKSQQGTGLGLPISQKYVQLMGGTIRVVSTPGIGSLFAFDIQVDLVEASEVDQGKTYSKIIGLAPNQPEYRILVVDDVVESRLLFVKLFTSLGFSVREAENGQEAIDLWSAWQPQLIFMDMHMPVMDGYEATKRIKALEKQLNDRNLTTAIVAFTASAFEEQRQTILAAGCDDFVRKPFQEEVLLEKIRQYLDVQYLYQDEMGVEVEQNLNQQIVYSQDSLIYLLSHMSSEWMANLQNFAAQGSDTLIVPLLQEIPLEKSPLKLVLMDLVHNFEFEKIIRLTQQVKHSYEQD